MRFSTTHLDGVIIITLEPRDDDRGSFTRTFCRAAFERQGLNPQIEQCSVSTNPRRGTLRGLHYQAAPGAEAKLVRCATGAIHDVVVDLRPDSPTRYESLGVPLAADDGRCVYVPEGCAHGYVTLTDDATVTYQMTAPFRPECARGVRYDDPRLGIEWPIEPVLISERDRRFPLINAAVPAIGSMSDGA